jgi:hypothetical protein
VFAAPLGQSLAFGWTADNIRILRHDSRFTAIDPMEEATP